MCSVCTDLIENIIYIICSNSFQSFYFIISDYSKALGALNEAERYLSKARNTPAATKQERLAVCFELFYFILTFHNNCFTSLIYIFFY